MIGFFLFAVLGLFFGKIWVRFFRFWVYKNIWGHCCPLASPGLNSFLNYGQACQSPSERTTLLLLLNDLVSSWIARPGLREDISATSTRFPLLSCLRTDISKLNRARHSMRIIFTITINHDL